MIRLGWRLALAGGPVRIASIIIGAAVSVVVLGVAWGLPDALHPIVANPDFPGELMVPWQRSTTMVLSRMSIAPVVVLLIATARLSSGTRDQRLVSLRLIGVSKPRTLLAAVSENVSVAALGAAVGVVGLFGAAHLVNTRLPVQAPLPLTPLHIAAYVGIVVGASALLALMSARSLQVLPTQMRRGGVARAPSWWRLVPAAVALGLLGYVLQTPRPVSDVTAWIFTGTLGVCALAIATTPALIARASARVLRRSGRTSLVMAGRGIEGDPTSSTRRVAAVGVGIFGLFVASSVLTIWESNESYRWASYEMEQGPTTVAVGAPWVQDEQGVLSEEDLTALSSMPGVHRVIPQHAVDIVGCRYASHSDTCPVVFIGTCEDLRFYLGEVACRDEQASWISLAGSEYATSPGIGHPEYVSSVGLPGQPDVDHQGNTIYAAGPDTETITVDGPELRPDWAAIRSQRHTEPITHLFVPTALLDASTLTIHRVEVIAELESAASVRDLAAERGLQAGLLAQSTYDELVEIRIQVAGFGTALIVVVLVVVTLSITDWVRESRRQRMRLLAIGVPRGVMARSHLVQFAIPLAGALVLGAILGAAAYVVFSSLMGLTVQEAGGIYVSSMIWWLTLALTCGVGLAAAVGFIAAREPMRPEYLRVE